MTTFDYPKKNKVLKAEEWTEVK